VIIRKESDLVDQFSDNSITHEQLEWAYEMGAKTEEEAKDLISQVTKELNP